MTATFYFDNVNSENFDDNNIHNLSNVDIQSLKFYLNQHDQTVNNPIVVTQPTSDDIKTIDFYVNQILMENSQSLNTNYPIEESVISDSSDSDDDDDDDYGDFSLDVAICGMAKNKSLPVPHENFSLTKGYFGDDAGFILHKEQDIFLGIVGLFFILKYIRIFFSFQAFPMVLVEIKCMDLILVFFLNL